MDQLTATVISDMRHHKETQLILDQMDDEKLKKKFTVNNQITSEQARR